MLMHTLYLIFTQFLFYFFNLNIKKALIFDIGNAEMNYQ